MKNKWVWLLAAAFTFLNLFLLLQNKREQAPAAKLFPNLSLEKIHAVELEMGSEHVYLEKLHGQWRLKDRQFPANKTYVDMLLTGLIDTPLGTKSTENVDIHEKFELEGRAWEIKVFGEHRTLLHRFYVGKYDPSYRGTYIRLHQDPTIRYVPIAYHVFMRRPTWADRTMWQFPESQLERITWQHGQKTQSWERSSTGFTNREGHSLPSEIVTLLTSPQAQNVIFDLDLGQIQIFGRLALLAGGAEIGLNIYKLDGQWYGRRDHVGASYVLAEELLSPFTSRQ